MNTLFTTARARHTIIAGTCLLIAQGGQANNIQITNSALTGNTGTSVQIQFDLSWENSWRGGAVTNWDAAWVFVKYRTSLAGPWSHANLNNTGHAAAAGSQIDLGLLIPGTAHNASTNPVVGVFVYRNAAGTGNLSLPGSQLQWNFAALGLNYADIAQVQVYAIEMVSVPQGAFFVGSGGTESQSLSDGGWVSGPSIPFHVETEGSITYGPGLGNLYFVGGSEVPIILSSAYPKGYNAFYCMKYEVTQQGYVDFLNTLTYAQQDTRTTNAPNSAAGTGAMDTGNDNRSGIDVQTPGVGSTTPAVYACNLDGDVVYGEVSDGKDIACNWMSWGDLTAYLDWSGLRPMSELEFEKACRGTIAPVPNEYPWSTASIAAGVYTLSDGGASNEGIATNYSTVFGNANYNLTNGFLNSPWRVGIFAANSNNSGRVTAGASYYGIMELGGNLFERTVTIGSTTGRAFTGTHGNGVLDTNGDPDGATWPTPFTANGAGFRGGASQNSASFVQVSDRSQAAQVSGGRGFGAGGRGARVSP